MNYGRAKFKRKIYLTRAFTFVELMIVMAIVAILAVIAILSYTNAQAKSRDSQRKFDLNKIAGLIEMYKTDNKSLPPDSSGGIVTVSGGSLYQALITSGNYTDKLPCDPKLGSADCPNGYSSGTGGYFYRYSVKNNAAVLSGSTSVSACSSGAVVIPSTNRDKYYSLYTRLENPTSDDTATVSSGCNFDYVNQFINSGSYTINFRVGN